MHLEGEAEPRRVEDGDVVLFPTGHPHSLYDAPQSPLTRLVQLDYNPQRGYQVVAPEGEGPRLLMLCGAFHFEYPNDFPLLHRLPKFIHIPGAKGQMKQGGKEAGKAGKSLGRNVKHGRILRGGKRFGKHIGYAGRHIGRGTKHAVKKVVTP